jgi:starch synthase
MKIVFAGSELTPFARTGGLGDFLDALPAALAARGHEVSLVLPAYRGLRETKELALRPTGVRIPIPIGHKRLDAEVVQGETPSGLQLFLIRRDEYFDRSGLYGSDNGDYSDNAERFVFFSKAVLELARRVAPPPEILHVNDWQTALLPVLVREKALPLRTVLTLHNLAFQGTFPSTEFACTNLPSSYFGADGLEFHGQLNLLKGGILHADRLTTVSEAYCREIQSQPAGCGLDGAVRSRARHLTGILNGMDSQLWNPAADPLLPHPFSAADLKGKANCKKALLEKTGLQPNPSGPVFVLVSRLSEQKGIDLLLPILDRLLADDVRLVVLGKGEPHYERDLLVASRKHAGKFAYLPELDERLSHLAEAGADISLFPSHFEPCGLTTMYSLRYGTPPVARATGGLHQIVQDTQTDSGNGFLFFDYNPEAFYNTLQRAKRLFATPDSWKALVLRAMRSEFSWDKAAERYERVYEHALTGTR